MRGTTATVFCSSKKWFPSIDIKHLHPAALRTNLDPLQQIPGQRHASEMLTIGIIIENGKHATRNTDHDIDS